MNTASSIEHDNFDPVEIKKFEDLASRWWDRNGEFKPLHDINPIRLNFINTGSALQGKSVLDIGCGLGGVDLHLVRGHAALVRCCEARDHDIAPAWQVVVIAGFHADPGRWFGRGFERQGAAKDVLEPL